MAMSDRIREFIVQKLMHEKTDVPVADEESLLDRGLLDSMGLLQLVTFLEKEYQVTIQDPDIVPENFESIHAISAFVQKLRGEAAV